MGAGMVVYYVRARDHLAAVPLDFYYVYAMTYWCGIGPGMEELGLPTREPHIECNSCGVKKFVSGRSIPPAWFMNGKAAPGWKLVRDHLEKRFDYCPKCSGGV